MQQSSAADSEVHVLCSSELRSAILDFLQHHSSTHGQEFVLLRSNAWARLSRTTGLATAGSAPAAVAEQQLGLESTHHAPAWGAAVPAAVDAEAAVNCVVRTLSDCTVPQGVMTTCCA